MAPASENLVLTDREIFLFAALMETVHEVSKVDHVNLGKFFGLRDTASDKRMWRVKQAYARQMRAGKAPKIPSMSKWLQSPVNVPAAGATAAGPSNAIDSDESDIGSDDDDEVLPSKKVAPVKSTLSAKAAGKRKATSEDVEEIDTIADRMNKRIRKIAGPKILSAERVTDSDDEDEPVLVNRSTITPKRSGKPSVAKQSKNIVSAENVMESDDEDEPVVVNRSTSTPKHSNKPSADKPFPTANTKEYDEAFAKHIAEIAMKMMAEKMNLTSV